MSNFGGQAPKPRPQFSPEHEINPLVEQIIANKQLLANYRVPGDNALDQMMDVGGTQVPVYYATLAVTHQLGIPYDHPNFPAVIKHRTMFPSYEHSVLWGSKTSYPWVKDSSFWHIPGFSRYVINKDGDIKNANSGAAVADGVFSSYAKLVPDGRGTNDIGVNGSDLLALSQIKIPEHFVDYGFRKYSHKLGPSENNDSLIWVPQSPVSAMGIDGTIRHCHNIHQFITNYIKDLNQKMAGDREVRSWQKGKVIQIGEYSVLEGKHDDPSAFGQSASSGMDADIPY